MAFFPASCSITNPNLSSLNRHTCFVLLHPYFFHFLLSSKAPSALLWLLQPFVALIASFFPLTLTPSLAIAFFLLLHFTPAFLLWDLRSLCSSLGKMSRQSWQEVSTAVPDDWLVNTAFNCFWLLVCVSVHVQKCTLSDLLWPWVYCQLRLIWLPQCGCKGRVVMIVLAYTGVHERRKCPLTVERGQLIEWRLKDWDVWDEKEKKVRDPTRPVNERREWMRLQRCGGSDKVSKLNKGGRLWIKLIYWIYSVLFFNCLASTNVLKLIGSFLKCSSNSSFSWSALNQLAGNWRKLKVKERLTTNFALTVAWKITVSGFWFSFLPILMAA